MSKNEDHFSRDPEENEANAREAFDLELENKALKDDLALRGMTDFYGAEDLDPAIENEFLNHVIEFEDAWENKECPTLAQLLPEGYPLPPAGELDDTAVKAKMAEIRELLAERGVEIGFNDAVPARVAYDHLLNECLDEEIMGPVGMPGYSYVLDGCSGCCEECFQLAYCKTGQKIQTESESESEPD